MAEGAAKKLITNLHPGTKITSPRTDSPPSFLDFPAHLRGVVWGTYTRQRKDGTSIAIPDWFFGGRWGNVDASLLTAEGEAREALYTASDIQDRMEEAKKRRESFEEQIKAVHSALSPSSGFSLAGNLLTLSVSSYLHQLPPRSGHSTPRRPTCAPWQRRSLASYKLLASG